MSQAARVLIVGLDGVPWDLVHAWAGAGYLPTLARLIAQGSAGPLKSTMPPTSGPAWSSFMTGKNPGQTGIYDFLYRRPGSYVFPPVNAALRSGQFHVVHAVEESVFIAALARLVFGVPYVYDMDSSLPQQLEERYPALAPLRGVLGRAESSPSRRQHRSCSGSPESASPRHSYDGG